MTRLSCHRFRSHVVRLWLSVIAYNLGNLWRLLMLPKKIDNWSLSFCMPETGGNGHLLTSGGTQHEKLQ